MKYYLQKLYANEKLSVQEAENLMLEIADGKHNHAQISSMLTVFLLRQITVNELIGFKNALMHLALKLDFSDFDTIDLCGTGGDGKNTFNISTLASFVVAGTGQKVAKHGNYGVSSVSGSSNMLEFFGYKFTNDAEILRKQLETANICFLHAPLFHPAMKTVAPVRKELGMKTIFNLLGPLVNPSNPQSQLAGVYNSEVLTLYGDFFKTTDKRFSVVHSADGYDEISLTSEFQISDNEGIKNLLPTDLYLETFNQSDLDGGNSVQENAKLFIDILEGRGTEAQNTVVCTNAGFALKTAQNTDFQTAYQKCVNSLQSGNALSAFRKLLETQ